MKIPTQLASSPKGLTSPKLLAQAGFVHIFLIIVLLLGIIGGVYLVQQKTNLLPKASEKPIIQAVDDKGQPLPVDPDKAMVVINKPVVDLVLHPPLKQIDNVIKSNTSLFQVLLDKTGEKLYSRRCNVTSEGLVEWEKCTDWVDEFIYGIRSESGKKYRSFDTFVLEDAKPVVYQSLVAESGEEGYTRHCLINQDSFGVVLDACSSWSTVDFRDLRSLGNEKYRSLNSYLIKESSNTVLKQSLVSESGQEGYARSCPVDTNGSYKVNWDDCSNWQTVDFTNLQGQGNESYASVSNFIITNKDGKSVLNQSLLDESGKTGLARSCPIKEEGIVWSECSGWSKIDLENLRKPGLWGPVVGQAYLSIANFPVTFKQVIIPPKVEFVRYKIAENIGDLAKFQALSVDPYEKKTSYFFSTLKPGKRTLYLRLFYSDGSTVDSSIDIWQATDDLYYLMPEFTSPQVGEYEGGKTVYYDIEGNTPQELMKDMTEKARRISGWNIDMWGATFYDYDWNWQAGCQNIIVNVELSFLMPRWAGYANAPEAFKKQWDKFYKSLDVHERGHAAIVNSGAEAIVRSLQESGCSNAAAYATYDQIGAQQREYDNKTTTKWVP